MDESSTPTAETRTARRFQFSLRSLLWALLIFSWLLVDLRQPTGQGFAVLLIAVGVSPLLRDVLRRTASFEASAQLLFGALVFATVCLGMFAAAALGAVQGDSGVLDYVTFAAVLFGVSYGVWVRSCGTEEAPCSAWAFWGYFAFLAGMLMLNTVLFAVVLPGLR